MAFIFYGRDMDQSLCACSAHMLPHSRGALCIFPIGKKFFFLLLFVCFFVVVVLRKMEKKNVTIVSG